MHKKKTEEKKTKSNEEREKIFGKTLDDKLKQTKENEKTFTRNFNMFGKYRDAIKSLKDEIKQLISRDSSEMTSQKIDERDLVVQAKVSTMKTMAKEYENIIMNSLWLGKKNKSNILLITLQVLWR